MTRARLRVDSRSAYTDVAGEVRVLVETGQQAQRRDIAGGDMGMHNIIELAVLNGMRRFGRQRHHSTATDDLVAGDLGLDQALVDRRRTMPPPRRRQPSTGK